MSTATALVTEADRMLANLITRLDDVAATLGKPAVAAALEDAKLGPDHATCASVEDLDRAHNLIGDLRHEGDELAAIADMAHEGHDRFGRATCEQTICRRFREAIG
jgi:hypothetical protein